VLGLLLRYISTQSGAKLDSSAGTNRLTSFYHNKEDYDQAFASAAATAKAPVRALAAVTSHHFLAKSLIAGTVSHIDPTNVKNVVIISPDHFNNITDRNVLAVTTTASWDTPYGPIETNQAQIEALTTLGQVKIQSKAFLNEHGVYTVIPFVKKQFPDARVVSLVLRNSDDLSAYEQLGKDFLQFFNPEDTLLLISSDFSHEATIKDSEQQDTASIRALSSLSISAVPNITSDCQTCIATAFGYLTGAGAKFQVIEQQHSYALSGQDENRVTSYISGLYVVGSSTQQPVADSKDITLLFGGDLMFDRDIRQKMTLYGNDHILGDLRSLFSQYDVVITNLEGPITNNPSRSVGSAIGSPSNFLFTFDPSVAKTLYDTNMRLVNLGNNHIQNFGVDGVTQTKEYLNSEGVAFFGDTGTETQSKDRTYIMEREGLKIGFVGYNQFTPEGLDRALLDVQTLRPNVDLLVVFPHWGNEYVPKANEVIQSHAHGFIDEGADLVIGSHPHVIQNVEEYKSKRIYYSLGNLVFDQYFSPETQRGMLVGVTIKPSDKSLSFSEYFVQLKTNGQTVLASPQPGTSPQP